eukprot:TRINITY_DN4438_c0_g1_i5.p1 TRINITY_DN4438_c0_g1~~TRINITY_DN4438_c0_g1_i5.p1  ORF type:complete len:422 (+),score=71.00 TRINITY_DN4438_c0_g1_i5:823-2088(+)
MTEEEKGERGTGAGDAKKEIMSPTKIKLHDTLVHAESNIIEFDGELSKEKKEKLKQLLYLFLNEAEYNRQARIYCIMTICVIITDIILLVVESDPNYDLPSIRASYNAFTILLFGPEMIARIAVHNAFTETWKEFLAKGYNFVDLIALFVQSVEVAFFLLGEHIHPLIKFLRVTSALRIIRIFKLSTFGRGVPIMIQGLRESSQALGILLFFTLICLVLISTLLYFVENIIYDIDSFENHGSFAKIEDIPTALWWAVITITTVGYGDALPVSPIGKMIASFSLIFGVLLLSLPVAIIGNKFQQLYLDNQKKEISYQRERTKNLHKTASSREEKEIYHIMMRLNELEEVNQTIEKELQDTQFLYRSLMRDAQNLIGKIDITSKDSTAPGKSPRKQDEAMKKTVMGVREDIFFRRQSTNKGGH